MVKYIELNAYMKLKGFAQTGGQSKNLIRSGEVLVNGEVEIRNKKKLIAGDKVSYKGNNFVVEEAVCLVEKKVE